MIDTNPLGVRISSRFTPCNPIEQRKSLIFISNHLIIISLITGAGVSNADLGLEPVGDTARALPQILPPNLSFCSITE